MLWVECGENKDGNCLLTPASSEQSQEGGSNVLHRQEILSSGAGCPTYGCAVVEHDLVR